MDPEKVEATTALDLYFTPTVPIFNDSYIEIKFPKGITLPNSTITLDDFDEPPTEDQWVRIPCEVMQGFDPDDIECELKLALIYKVSEIFVDEKPQEVKTLIGIETSNLVRIKNIFMGKTLVWKEPPKKKPIYIPNAPVVPPWIDADVDHRKKEFNYVDGEWINLDTIEVVGDKTFDDIDLDKDGNLPKHEILVYFAKLADIKQKEYNFKLNY